jgi:hypothetical protein
MIDLRDDEDGALSLSFLSSSALKLIVNLQTIIPRALSGKGRRFGFLATNVRCLFSLVAFSR